MVSSLRRLAAEHAALHDSDLPPYYLFPSENSLSSADDLTQLTVLLAGPQGTPYSQGLWRLHLKMPEDYPKNPPKASFRTKIWHPNVEELTGAVCVDTLKRDWQSKLTLRDVLVTISCLLIHPNPDSALNSAAGALLQDDYDAFARQAKMMTSVHAPVPEGLSSAVTEAKLRGEDAGTVIQEQEQPHHTKPQKATKVHSLRMKKKPAPQHNGSSSLHPSTSSIPEPSTRPQQSNQENTYTTISDDEDEDLASATKENDPSLSPSPVKLAPPSPRKNAHGKRPLSVLSTPLDPETGADNSTEVETMTESEKNIAANEPDHSPQRKSPKLSILGKNSNFPSRSGGGGSGEELTIFEDPDSSPVQVHHHHRTSLNGSENYASSTQDRDRTRPHTNNPHSNWNPPSSSSSKRPLPASRTVSSSSSSSFSSSSSSSKRKPRVGIRRL